MDANAAWQGPTANKTNDKRDIDRLREEEKDQVKLLVENVLEDVEEEDVKEENTKWETAICKGYDFGLPEQDVPKDPIVVDMSIEGGPGTHVTGQALAAMLYQLKWDHGEAKAVKSDNAAVPVKIWDKALCKGPPSDAELRALVTLRSHCLGQNCQKLWLDAGKFLIQTHGKDWVGKVRLGNASAVEDAEAIHDILWQAAENSWFKYRFGLRLNFFCFPAHYQTQAKQGARVLFTCKGPSSRHRQLSSQTRRRI